MREHHLPEFIEDLFLTVFDMEFNIAERKSLHFFTITFLTLDWNKRRGCFGDTKPEFSGEAEPVSGRPCRRIRESSGRHDHPIEIQTFLHPVIRIQDSKTGHPFFVCQDPCDPAPQSDLHALPSHGVAKSIDHIRRFIRRRKSAVPALDLRFHSMSLEEIDHSF